jgi:Transposase and inactivated derivatives
MKLPHSLAVSIRINLRELEMLFENHTELMKEMKALCAKERYKASVIAKDSCPGIGWLTAIRLTLEWGDMRRFATGKHIASFTGLTASEYSTGETIRKGRITAQSSSTVRSWLIECAWRAIRKDPVLLDKFHRVAANSGSTKKAVVAVARKLAVRMWALETGTQHTYVIGVIE